jgi:hypothetical protein
VDHGISAKLKIKMIELVMLSIGLVAAFVCIVDWRKGIFISIIVGFIQDPIRKITPDEPLYLTTLVGLFVMMSFLGAKMKRQQSSIQKIDIWKFMKKPLTTFIIFVFIQSAVAFYATQSLIITVIGLIAYLSPLPTLLLAYNYSTNEENIFTFIKFYLFISTLMLSGIYLSYFGFDWQILKSVGVGLFAYDPTAGRLELLPGFLRAPEVAAWHAGASICLLIILFVSQKHNRSSIFLAVLLSVFFMFALILTGRRKAIMEIIMFISAYGFFLFYFKRGAAKLAFFLFFLGLALVLFMNMQFFSGETSVINPYYQRSLHVQTELTDRLYNMTIGSFKWVIERNGFFGSGAGTGSQGAQHFGGGSVITGDAAEGGLAKIMAELGVPGFLIFLWLGFSLFRYLWRIINQVKDIQIANITFGLSAFLLANTVVFMTAHQVFGDLFVLLIIGWMLGFILSIPIMQQKKQENILHIQKPLRRSADFSQE